VSNNSTLRVTTVLFERNEGTRGGAVRVSESSDATISNCSFTNNTASLIGGAILLYDNSTISLANSTLSGGIRASVHEFV